MKKPELLAETEAAKLKLLAEAKIAINSNLIFLVDKLPLFQRHDLSICAENGGAYFSQEKIADFFESQCVPTSVDMSYRIKPYLARTPRKHNRKRGSFDSIAVGVRSRGEPSFHKSYATIYLIGPTMNFCLQFVEESKAGGEIPFRYFALATGTIQRKFLFTEIYADWEGSGTHFGLAVATALSDPQGFISDRCSK